MTGKVLDHHVIVGVELLQVDGTAFEMQIEVDTGFIGFLTLPTELISVLSLPFVRRQSATLADNSTIRVEIFSAQIIWGGGVKKVDVIATEVTPLLGTLLLDGCEMNIKFVEGGKVTIEALAVAA